jgi:putative membrane-bound dehydrogenase-like protein
VKPNQLSLIFCLTTLAATLHAGELVTLFDGETFTNWEGNTQTVWRIEDGVIVGGSLEGNPQNEFLATTKDYKNFHLRLEYKLIGTEGFVNGGVQFHSQRIENPANEMSGYQADIGAGYSGFLYDESRRNRFMAEADKDFVARTEKPGEWNHYEIIATGERIMIFLNGQRTSVFFEKDESIPQFGKIALQIHGNSKAEIAFRNIVIEELSSSGIPPQDIILSRFGTAQPVSPQPPFSSGKFELGKDEVVVFAGQENFVREQKSGELESILAAYFADKRPRFRSMAWEADTVYEQWRDLNFGDWSAQLEAAGATVIIAQFGQMEALDGPARLTEFVSAYHRLLDQFSQRTRRLVLISPMLFEKPLASHAPDLTLRNGDVRAYSDSIKNIAQRLNAVFVDLTKLPAGPRLTEDGVHLTPDGLRRVAAEIARQLGARENPESLGSARLAMVKKNRLWFDCWRPANWSFVYGDRVSQMYGKGGGDQPSLQTSFERQLPLVESADEIIYDILAGKLAREIAGSPAPLEEEPGITPEEQMEAFTMAEGYKVNLFASEADGVANPVQIAWDERGRLYVACSPSYPQTLAGAPPQDYIQVLEDTDRDGRADKSWRFAEGLSMVQGVEPAGDGVYVCDFDRILFLRDTDGDGKADEYKVLLSGFGVGDTHQLVNSVSHGPDGSVWFTQGLHAISRVETPHGIARLDRAGVWRFRPNRLQLESFFGGGMAGANCWGVAFDDFGQVFHKTGDRPEGYWTVPGMVFTANSSGGSYNADSRAAYLNSPEQYHSVGPLFETSPKTTSIDIIGTSAMPDDIQGAALIGGYFGSVVELHQFHDAGSGFKTTQLPKLMTSTDNAFRPVDVSGGPDGALYLADWFNPIIGHYQASYADPRRDKTHGRIWRVTAKGYPAVDYPNLSEMTSDELIAQLASPERWVRYQAKRVLYYLPTNEVIKSADKFLSGKNYESFWLELIGIYQAHETVRPELLNRLLESDDFRIRAYGARVLGEWGSRLKNSYTLLQERVTDTHPRVRLEAVVAASYLQQPEAVKLVTSALDRPLDPFLEYAIRQSARSLQTLWEKPFREGNLAVGSFLQDTYLRQLLESGPELPSAGEAVFQNACIACHQPGGKGLPGVYPPLLGSEFVKGDEKRLIKIVLNGLTGPVDVAGEKYGAGTQSVPMPGMSGMSNEEIAEVLSYIRKEFGDGAPAVDPATIESVRSELGGRTEPWTIETLMR